MKAFKKILIANRGEIASRVIKASKELGIKTVSIYVKQDSHLDFVNNSDESVLLKGETVADTYLNINQIITVAKTVNADAIHPGYGFLSENSEFAKKCSENNVVFIGPDASSIEQMGDKINARRIALETGIPVLPSVTGSIKDILDKKEKLSYPVIIKASAGGGGKGMKIIHYPEELEDAVWLARKQAIAYFGNETLYLEKYLEKPRHIEIQIFGDDFGNYVHLFERECSVQRRHQKIIEESPSPNISSQLRENLIRAALKLAKTIMYTNAGTVEFLVQDDEFYFLEMNTRIQVEHPVTEEATGIDLVKEQINVAQGTPLSFTQQDVKLLKYAIECRIYAEDPVDDFCPSPGNISYHSQPNCNETRVDSISNKNQFIVPSDFDPMLAKVIASGNSREVAIEKMTKALNDYCIHGIKNNIAYLKEIFKETDFKNGITNTKYIDNHHQNFLKLIDENSNNMPHVIPLVAAYLYKDSNQNQNNTIWKRLGRWRSIDKISGIINGKTQHTTILSNQQNLLMFLDNNQKESIGYDFLTVNKILLIYNNNDYQCIVTRCKQSNQFEVTVNGLKFFIERDDILPKRSFEEYNSLRKIKSSETNGFVKSPLNGRALKVNFKNGDSVVKGDILLIIESMKTENRIISEYEGVVSELTVNEGEQVKGEQILLRIN